MRKLTVKQEAFKEAMLKGETPINAARFAGYAGNNNTLSQIAHKMVMNGKIIKAIKDRRIELQAETGITVKYLQDEHQRLRMKAEDKGDLANATRNLELMGRTIAAYADKNINLEEQTVIIIGPKQSKSIESKEIPSPLKPSTADNDGLGA